MSRTVTAHSGFIKSKKGKVPYLIQWNLDGYYLVSGDFRVGVDDLYRTAQASTWIGIYELEDDLHADSVMREIRNFRNALKR